MCNESEGEDTFRNVWGTAAPALTPGPNLTLEGLEATVERMQQEWKEKRDNPLHKMKIVPSRFLPEGFCLWENGELRAIHNLTTGKMLVLDVPDLLNAPMKIEIEPEVKEHAYRFWEDRCMPALYRPYGVVTHISHDDFHADAYGVLRPQRYKDSARCRQRHYRARRQGGKGR